MVSISTKVEFLGEATSAEERLILSLNGFVHVTGLQYFDGKTQESLGFIGEQTLDNELGCWGRNNGKQVIVTMGGEIWLRSEISIHLIEEGLFARFCPNHEGAFVPLSNGEYVSLHNLLSRVANPSYNILIAG